MRRRAKPQSAQVVLASAQIHTPKSSRMPKSPDVHLGGLRSPLSTRRVALKVSVVLSGLSSKATACNQLLKASNPEPPICFFGALKHWYDRRERTCRGVPGRERWKMVMSGALLQRPTAVWAGYGGGAPGEAQTQCSPDPREDESGKIASPLVKAKPKAEDSRPSTVAERRQSEIWLSTMAT